MFIWIKLGRSTSCFTANQTEMAGSRELAGTFGPPPVYPRSQRYWILLPLSNTAVWARQLCQKRTTYLRMLPGTVFLIVGCWVVYHPATRGSCHHLAWLPSSGTINLLSFLNTL